MVYDQVEKAINGYNINIGGASAAITETTTSRNISSDLIAGTYNVKVSAKGNGKDVLPSNYTAPIEVVRLDAPQIVRIDMGESDSRLVLNEPSLGNTLGYKLIFNEIEEESVVETLDNIATKISTLGTDVKVKAVANYYQNQSDKTGTYYMTSLASASKRFVKLQAPTNLAFDNNSLSWNMAGINKNELGKITYKVMDAIKGTTVAQGTSEQSINFSRLSNLEDGKDYLFKVKAIGDGEYYIDSDDYSTAKQVYKLARPEVMKNTATGEYYWMGVSQTTNYAVYINGENADGIIHTSSSNIYTFNPVSFFKDLTTYNVEVIAVGNGAIGDTPTINSSAFVITQQTTQLTKPEFSVSYTHEQYDTEGKIKVTITKETPNAKRYKYVVGGKTSLETDDGTTYEINPNGTGSFDVNVYAVGGTFDDEGKFTLDSQSYGTQTITILGYVNSSKIELNDWKVRWFAVEKAQRYKVEIFYDGSNVPEVIETADLSYDIPDDKKITANSIIVKITALGNGSNIITSAPSTSREFSNLQR